MHLQAANLLARAALALETCPLLLSASTPAKPRAQAPLVVLAVQLTARVLAPLPTLVLPPALRLALAAPCPSFVATTPRSHLRRLLSDPLLPVVLLLGLTLSLEAPPPKLLRRR
mmetsp:Transcript_14256/g.46819  ORF Transcript_14256/g.46819 Transcript_14256/m.46819 type:complete len:114 (+) Transcript_14256:1983-2324(+)